MTNKDQALSAFLARKHHIDEMLKRLQDASDNHFDTDPDKITWGDAGSLGYIEKQLQIIVDFTFGEGEHAE